MTTDPLVPPGADAAIPGPARWLALPRVTAGRPPPRVVKPGKQVYARASENFCLRPRAEAGRFFAGPDLMPRTRAPGRRSCMRGGVLTIRSRPTLTGRA